jgi:signal transduction histidine kinase
MATAVPSGAPRVAGPMTDRPPLLRPHHGRVLAGVCRGVATHLGVSVVIVRLVFGLLGVFGPGIAVYAFLWLTMSEGEQGASLLERRAVPKPVLIGLGVLIAATAVSGVVLGSAVDPSSMLPLLAIGSGLVLTWSMLDQRRRQTWLSARGMTRRESLARVGLGALLVLGGLAVLVSSGRGLGGLRDVLLATLVFLVGVTLLMAPFALRLWDDFRREQTERIRQTEKADIAAHLHDSVLQTLALIQRRANDPTAVQRLARGQERELRQWLFADATPADATLASAVTATTHELEDQLGTPIDLVVTGDRPLDPHAQALVSALREAMSNAVRHGAPPVSAYVEIGPAETEAFVRDHGVGFDPESVPGDRLGVRESIVGRMERHGGSARLRRRDPGTEIELRLPHDVPEEATQP